MVEKPALTQLLKANAGISAEAALVYKHVLTVGTLTIGEVCEYTGFGYDVASKALNELIDGRLLRRLQHVVDRYVAVAPYRIFAEHLVDFQRTVKDIEEEAKKSVDKTLVAISRTDEEWKASATRVREEELARGKQETSRLKEECHTARSSLIEKLRHETEEKKSGIIESLKKDVEDHSTRVSEIENDISLKLDNSATKFAEVAKKLQEEVTQLASSFLSRLDEKMQLFLSDMSRTLGTFSSEFSSSIQEFLGKTLALIDESNKKMNENARRINTETSSLLHEFEQTYGQLSTELQRKVSNDISSTIEAVSSANKELESNVESMLQKHGEKLNEDMVAFEKEAHETMELWGSAYKGELVNQVNSLESNVEGYQQGLTQKLELTKTAMSELLGDYSTGVKGAADKLGCTLSVAVESIKKDLPSKLDAPRTELRKSCGIASKNCIALASMLESLSKKNIPLTSKTISDFTLDFKSKLSKMKTTILEEMKSFVGNVRQRILTAVSAAEKIGPSSGNPYANPVEKGDDPSSQPTDDPPAASTSRGKKPNASRAKNAILRETTKKMDELGKTYIEATKKTVDTLDKSISERISTVLRFEDELEQRWQSITASMTKVTELAESIGSFPSEIDKPVDELVRQCNEKLTSTISNTKRLLNAHISSLADQASGTQKAWNATIDKTKRELSELLIKRQEEIAGLASKQIDSMQKILADRGKELGDLASGKVETFKSQSLSAQSTMSRLVASNTVRIKGSLEDIAQKLKDNLETNAQGFGQEIESKCKESDDLLTRVISETAMSVTNLKKQFETIVSGKKEEVRQLCEDTSSELKETLSENSRDLHSIVSSLADSFKDVLNATSEGYKKECESAKALTVNLLSEHVKVYTEAVTKITGEINSAFSEHFDDCSETTASFEDKLEKLLTTHQNGYEEYSNNTLSGLVNCMDRDEAAINQNTKKMLTEFTENTTKIAKESNSVETLMRTAWAEITDTQQINSDKTWHYVTKGAILNHIKDMTKRTKSTVTIVLPNLDEVPLKEIKEISKSIRINIVAGVDETYHKKLLKELLTQGNVRTWSLAERDYISCTRDAEEVLIAPVAKRDLDCVATVSTEENYVKLYHKFIGPMWMASSREVKERELR